MPAPTILPAYTMEGTVVLKLYMGMSIKMSNGVRSGHNAPTMQACQGNNLPFNSTLDILTERKIIPNSLTAMAAPVLNVSVTKMAAFIVVRTQLVHVQNITKKFMTATVMSV